MESEKLATLFLPTSKSDIGGSGVSRSLRCTCEVSEFDRRTCPAHTLERQVALRSEVSGVDPSSEEAWDVPLFPRRDGGIPSKEALVQAWCSLVLADAPRPTGHSGRRAGAKFYARRGGSARAFLRLGRWPTYTLLAYIGGALAELPGGRRLLEDLPRSWAASS